MLRTGSVKNIEEYYGGCKYDSQAALSSGEWIPNAPDELSKGYPVPNKVGTG